MSKRRDLPVAEDVETPGADREHVVAVVQRDGGTWMHLPACSGAVPDGQA